MLGPDAPALAWVVRHIAEPVGQLFLRSLLMTVVPLVVSSLIVGVAGIGDVRRRAVRRRTVGYLPLLQLSRRSRILLANTVRPGCGSTPRRAISHAQYGTLEAGPRRRTTNDSPLMSFARISCRRIPSIRCETRVISASCFLDVFGPR